MGKFRMPSVRTFLRRKFINDKNKEDVWVYLDREMKAAIAKKPYNKRVGKWLIFLKDLKAYYRREENRKYRRIRREVGPNWYIEFCTAQRQILRSFKADMYEDILEDLPIRVTNSLRKIGVTADFPHDMLLKAMKDAVGDPGLFIWFLYKAFYKKSPNVLQSRYSLNQMLMLSCLVFIDYDECIEALEELTSKKKQQKAPRPKKPMKYFEPRVKYGMYLQKMYASCRPPHLLSRPKPKPPPGLDYKIKLRSPESLEKLVLNDSFLKLRLERNAQKFRDDKRVCNYKFWEPPISLRATDAKMAAYVEKLKMVKMKAKARHAKLKPPFENQQCHIGTVAYCGGAPRYMINNYCLLPTGYIPINGGIKLVNNEYVNITIGMWKFPKETQNRCDETCACVHTWESSVIEYIKNSKCKCYHRYDYYNEGKSEETYMYKSTKNLPYWIDKAKVYQLDPTEDFIRDEVLEALNSETVLEKGPDSLLSISGMKLKVLLAAFLADLSDSPLIIPHLPKANLLVNLQAWVRKKIFGSIPTAEVNKRLSLISQRRWLDLRHMDFRARAFLIPFTQEELHRMNYSHYDAIQELAGTLLQSFLERNKKKIVQQSRLWWSTMKHDIYPSAAFSDIFFTYMPVKMNDIYLLNPYSSHFVRYAGRGCGVMK